MVSGRLWPATALSLLVLSLAAAIVVYEQGSPPRDQGQTPGYSVGPVSSAAVSTAPSAVSVPSPSPASVRTVFLGDDYTLGVGAPSAASSWTTLLAADLNLNATVVGIAGAGYARESANGRTYRDLVSTVVAAHPAVVVVSGGRNDVTDSVATLDVEASGVFAALRAQLPDATIIAIAPLWGDSDQPATLKAVAQAVRVGVRAVHGSYLRIADPLHGHPSWMADDADPNAKGYAAIAKALKPKLAALLPGAS